MAACLSQSFARLFFFLAVLFVISCTSDVVNSRISKPNLHGSEWEACWCCCSFCVSVETLDSRDSAGPWLHRPVFTPHAGVQSRRWPVASGQWQHCVGSAPSGDLLQVEHQDVGIIVFSIFLCFWSERQLMLRCCSCQRPLIL